MKLFARKETRKGIAMTEYLIILGVVALAAIFVVSLFGKQIKSVFSRSNAALTGVSQNVDNATVTASTGASKQQNMGTFQADAAKTGQ